MKRESVVKEVKLGTPGYMACQNKMDTTKKTGSSKQ